MQHTPRRSKRAPKKYSEELENQIIDYCHKNQVTIKETAKHFGITTNTAAYLYNRKKEEARRRPILISTPQPPHDSWPTSCIIMTVLNSLLTLLNIWLFVRG